MTFPIKFLITVLVMLQASFLRTHADVDKDALPNVEEGFQINQPAPLWFFSSQVLDRDSKLLLKV